MHSLYFICKRICARTHKLRLRNSGNQPLGPVYMEVGDRLGGVTPCPYTLTYGHPTYPVNVIKLI